MRTSALLMAVAAGLALVATPAAAQQQVTVTATPNSGPAGSSTTFTWTGFIRCKGTVRINWGGAVLATAPWVANGSVTANIPGGIKEGSYVFTANDDCNHLARNTFQVTPPPPVTTTTPPPVTTKPPVTTTRPPVTTTTPGTTTTTDTPSSSSSEAPSSSGEPSDPGDGVLVLDKDNIQPGE
ncbi:hypothetical protein LFM09_50065, partial [Lentzea alba]